jgi:hypothetical protein
MISCQDFAEVMKESELKFAFGKYVLNFNGHTYSEYSSTISVSVNHIVPPLYGTISKGLIDEPVFCSSEQDGGCVRRD